MTTDPEGTSPRGLFARLRSSALARNTGALYGVHFANLALPLVTLPFLARVLEPSGWGLVVFTQSFAAWLGLISEYGFHLSATRLVARNRGDRAEIARIVAGVHGAKLMLAVIVTCLAAVAYLALPLLRDNPRYALWGWLLAISIGGTPLWYFQGIERMTGAAAAEVVTRVAATAGMFLMVRGPEDGWVVLALQAVAGLTWVVAGTSWIYGEVGARRLSVGSSTKMLREGGAIFAFRSAGGLYMQANAFILGLFGSTNAVAFFGSAERLVRAATGLIQPASQALFPRMSGLVERDRGAAVRLVRASAFIFGAVGAAIGIGVAVGAPVWVRVLLGPGYEASVPVLRILGLVSPIVAVGTVVGVQWALPLGLDSGVLRCVVAGGLVNLVAAVVLVPRAGEIGMAVSVVAAEATVAVGLLLLVRRAAHVRSRAVLEAPRSYFSES